MNPRTAHQHSYDIPQEQRALLEEIDDTRAEMDAIIDELQRRMSPDYIVNQSMNTIQRKTQDMKNQALETVKNNPLPLALIGGGLAWMIAQKFTSDKRQSYDTTHRHYPNYSTSGSRANATERDASDRSRNLIERGQKVYSHATDKAGDAYGTGKGKTQEAFEHGREKLSDAYHTMRDKTEQCWTKTMDTTSDAYETAVDKISNSYNDYPLLFIAAAVGAGVAAGVSLPATKRENRWMGDYRDHLFGQISNLGHDAVQHGKEALQSTAQAATATAEQELEKHGKELREEAEWKPSNEAKKAEKKVKDTPDDDRLVAGKSRVT